MGDTTKLDAWAMYCNAFRDVAGHKISLELSPTAIALMAENWTAQELASLRAEKEFSDALLKDWNALMLASTMDGIPEAFRSMASVPKLWPNEWHQDCAAVAFMIKTLREQKERAEAEVARLNQWADSFTDAHLKERQTGDALVKETMQRALKAEAERDAALKDAERINALIENSWDLRCTDLPTGGGDSNIGWQVIGHYMQAPNERVIAEVFHDDPRAAIDAAIDAARKGEQ